MWQNAADDDLRRDQLTVSGQIGWTQPLEPCRTVTVTGLAQGCTVPLYQSSLILLLEKSEKLDLIGEALICEKLTKKLK